MQRELRFALLAVLVTAALLRLVFAQAHPDGTRFWDEKYTFENVAAILAEGRWQPENALYPSLSFAPQTGLLALSDALYRLTGAKVFSVFADRETKDFSATAYLLARGVSVFCGVWSLWLLYRLGRRVLDPATALVGTLLLATFWRHLSASGEFKPDVVALALTLLAAGWCLEAAARRTWPAFLLAGAGIGLATAAKYNAALVALVLLTAVALQGRQAARELPRLAAAGGASIAVFSLLNPWVPLVLRDFGLQMVYYTRTATSQGSGYWTVLVGTADFFFRHHGTLVALCAAVGTLALAWRGLRDVRQHRELLSLLAFAVGYPLVYAAITRLFRSQNLLLVVPFTSLFAGWAMVAGWRWLARLWRPLGSRAATVTAFVALFLAAHRFPVTATYAEVVPTTAARCAAWLSEHLRPAELRLGFYELGNEKIRGRPGSRLLAIVPVERLDQVEPHALDLADCEIFAAERLAGELYRKRIARPAVTRLERVAPRLFFTRGQELVIALHPWHELGPPRLLEVEDLGHGRRRSRLDGSANAGDVFSISATAPHRGVRHPTIRLRIGGRLVPFYSTGIRDGTETHFISQRQVLGPGSRELILELGRAGEAALTRLELHRWQAAPP